MKWDTCFLLLPQIPSNTMSYSSKRRYTSRREKNKKVARGIKKTTIIAILAAIVVFYQYRVSILDYLNTYFY